MSTSSGAQTLRLLIAWAVLLTILGLLNRTRFGHTAIYYLLVLAIFLLLVTQYRALSGLLAPVSGAPTLGGAAPFVGGSPAGGGAAPPIGGESAFL